MDLVELFLEVQREGLLHGEAGEISDEDGWLQLTTPDAPVIWRNAVQLAVLSDDEVDARIDAVLAHYDALNVPFLWRVTPACRPKDLGQRLLDRGFGHFETLHCMTADPRAFSAPEPGPVTLEEATPDTLELWVETMGDGWDMPEGGRERARRALQREFRAQVPRVRYFLARCDGEPAATASMSFYRRAVHFSGASVLPAFRGRGVYRASILERMRVMREAGRDLATVNAVSTTSAPILRRMGFEDACVFEGYSWDP